MTKRKPESIFEILPYEETFSYDSECFIVDVSTSKNRIIKWLDDRTKAIEDYSDIYMDLSISSEGFHITFKTYKEEPFFMSMRINHVVALQLKQACEHYIDCYDKHRLQNDITIYRDSQLLQ
jgi:hypothetical protein